MSFDSIKCAFFTSLLLLAAACGGRDEKPLATVGDEEITDQQFAAHLRFKNLTDRGEAQTAGALDEYVKRAALAQAIESSGRLDTGLIQAELEDFRREMLISRYFEQFLRTAVTDQAIRNYYDAHASEYEERKVHVAHVLIRTNRRMTDTERQAARTKAQEAYSALQSGRDFAEVAQAFSEDRVSSARGGDLGSIRQGAIDARFSELAFSTPVGQITEPFETPFGFHILKVIEAPQATRRPLEAVEGDIRYALRSQAKEAELRRLRESVEVQTRRGGYRAPPSARNVPDGGTSMRPLQAPSMSATPASPAMAPATRPTAMD